MFTYLMDQSPVIMATGISLIIFLFLVVIGWTLKKKANIDIGSFFNLFALITGVYAWLSIAYQSGLLAGSNIDVFLLWYYAIVLFLGIWYITKLFLILFWDKYLTGYRDMQIPVLLRNLVLLLVLIATIILIAKFVFRLELSGLLVASSVTAAVIAFALQDFLGGLISGIALSIQPPFEVGEWIKVDGHKGRVIDINWRDTTLYTLDKTYLIVPNSVITKEKIINFYRPTQVHEMHVSVGVDYEAPPNNVKDILEHCALDTGGVESKPEPRCRLVEFGDHSITYNLQCCIRDQSQFGTIRDKVMTRIWYSLKREGINIPFPIRDIYVHEEADRETNIKEKRKKKRKYFREADIFKPLDDENLEMLMSDSSHWFYGRGECIVKQAESGDSVYLILEGSAGVHVEIPGNKELVNVGHLSSGDFFGEKSLLTGEPRGATVKAESDIEVAEIEKRDIAPILEATPGIAKALSERLAERQLINEGFFEDAQQNQDVEEARKNYSQHFLQNIQSFFGL